jgi:hypothetical protein
MKLSFLKYRTGSQLKKNKSIRANIPFREATTIGIVFTIEDRVKHELIKDFIHKLEHDGKKVQVMTFLPNKQENHDFMFDFFTMKDISFFGEITSYNTIKFADTPFDYLFCIDTESNKMIQYILARSKSKCRVGKFENGNEAYFEMMLDSTKNTKEFIDGIYKYTTQLK